MQSSLNQSYFEQAARAASRDSGVLFECTGYQNLGPVLQAARFRMANGLTILLVPDARAPIFAYQTWFKVGSKNEDPKRTGLAHLFEHLMFKGTARHPLGEFDREMEIRGSQTNAATWVDWTYYTEALAVRGDNLSTVIDFEADRMTGLLLTQDTLVSELEVVKNERRMTVEDSIAGTLSEYLLDLAFTTHPYRWPTIGSMEHLEASSIADLEQFYRTYYAPNNATVVLVGDLEVAATLTALGRGYGHLASQPLQPKPCPVEPAQQAYRERTIYRPMVSPQVVLGYHAPAQSHADFVALEMAAEVLTAGDTGRLHQRLVTDEQLATDVSGFLAPFAEPGIFEFHVTVRQDVPVQRVIDVLQEELDLLQKGLSTSELDKARNGLELGHLDALKDVEGCAEALGHHQTNYNDFGRAFAVVDKYASITSDQVCAASRRVFQKACCSAVIALPGEPTENKSER